MTKSPETPSPTGVFPDDRIAAFIKRRIETGCVSNTEALFVLDTLRDAAHMACCQCDQVCGNSIKRERDELVATQITIQCARGRLRMILDAMGVQRV